MTEDNRRYRICWRAGKTGAEGSGTALFSLSEARRIAADLNQKDKDLHLFHWPAVYPDERAEHEGSTAGASPVKRP